MAKRKRERTTPARRPRASRAADAAAEPNEATPEGGEQRGAPTMGVAVISGVTFANKAVVYYEVDGMAIVEGDIALGTVESVQQATEAAREAARDNPMVAHGVGITGSRFRWPNCQVPYEIDPALPNQQRVTDAIAHWEANTGFRFPLRTPANQHLHPNWVRFTDAGGCWSMVGMQGGQQTISLGPGCTTGNTIHEIGHAVGLWHEQSREDRDLFVTINWANIQDGMAAQFNQRITDGDDLWAYDYGSVMHYPRKAFSRNGLDTIVPTDPAALIGQRTGLSPGDIAAVREMYPACGGVPKQPWLEPVKKVRDEPLPKSVRDPKPVLDPKPVRDPKPVLDPKPIRDPKTLLDPLPKGPRDPLPKGRDPIPPILPQPVTGGVQPFSLATPHHALLGSPGLAGGDPTAGAYLAELQQQLLDVEAALAQARATAAQAAADAARLEQSAAAISTTYEQVLNGWGGRRNT